MAAASPTRPAPDAAPSPQPAERFALLAIDAPADRHSADVAAYTADLLAAGYRVALIHNDPAAIGGMAAAVTPVRSPALGAFALWRDALRHLELPRADTASVLLASTGLCGPLAPLPPVLARFDHTAADLWGLTESWIGQYHLPACFIGCGGRAIRHPAWAAFWNEIPAHPDRAQIARQLEIDLTQTLLAAGFSAASVWPYRLLLDEAGAAFAALRAAQLAAEPGARDAIDEATRLRLEHLRRIRTLQANRTPMEPLQFFWRELLDLGAPFVSRDLLTRNPHGIVTARECAARISGFRALAY